MIKSFIIFIVGVILGNFSFAGGMPAAKGAQCPYLPQFKTLLKKLPSMKPVEGLIALDRYQTDPNNDSPHLCESEEIARQQEKRETRLIYLRINDEANIYAQAVFHCGEFDPKTTQCDGVFMDDTALLGYRNIVPIPAPHRKNLVLKSEIDGFRLAGLYRTLLSSDGLKAKAVNFRKQNEEEFDLGSISMEKNSVFIAIFRSSTGLVYRKFVWFF